MSNKIYFNLNHRTNGSYYFNSISNYSLSISTIVHNYLNYLLIKNNSYFSPRTIRRKINDFANSITDDKKLYSVVFKSLIVSIINNRYGFNNFNVIKAGLYQLICDCNKKIYMTGPLTTRIPNKVNYNYFFTLSTLGKQNNNFDIDVYDPIFDFDNYTPIDINKLYDELIDMSRKLVFKKLKLAIEFSRDFEQFKEYNTEDFQITEGSYFKISISEKSKIVKFLMKHSYKNNEFIL